MRRALLILAFILTGCSEASRYPELAACEEYNSKTLKSPATYKRAKAYISDETMPAEYWTERERDMFGKSTSFSDLYKTFAKEGGIRTVVIEYDAANAYGTPVRGIQACKFELTSIADSKFSTEPSASSSVVDLMMVQAGVQPDSGQLGCCMSRNEFARIEKFQRQAKFVTQKVIE